MGAGDLHSDLTGNLHETVMAAVIPLFPKLLLIGYLNQLFGEI